MYIFEIEKGILGATNVLQPHMVNFIETVNGDCNVFNYYLDNTNKIIYNTKNPIATRLEFKKTRQQQVDNIEVTYNGNIYQGDETSQNRMTRAILAMTDTEVIPWVTKDNKNVNLSKVDLSSILKQAGIIQTSLWT